MPIPPEPAAVDMAAITSSKADASREETDYFAAKPSSEKDERPGGIRDDEGQIVGGSRPCPYYTALDRTSIREGRRW